MNLIKSNKQKEQREIFMNFKKAVLSLGVLVLSAGTIYANDGYTEDLSKIGIDAKTFYAMPAEKQEMYANLEFDSMESQDKYFKFKTANTSDDMVAKASNVAIDLDRYDRNF